MSDKDLLTRIRLAEGQFPEPLQSITTDRCSYAVKDDFKLYKCNQPKGAHCNLKLHFAYEVYCGREMTR